MPNMEKESRVSEGRDRGSLVSVGGDRASSVKERDTTSTISIEKDRASGVPVGRDGERSNVHVRKDLSRDLGSISNIQEGSSVSVEGDWEASNFICEDISGALLSDISIVMEGSCSLGEGYRENGIVSGKWGTRKFEGYFKYYGKIRYFGEGIHGKYCFTGK